MVTCMECGYTAHCLQWTHFKNKCTGKYKTIAEYKAAYPDAKTVSAELAAKYAITEENLIRKYGHDEGKQRWKSYCEKQSYSNSFEYKSKKYNWSKEDFDQYNKSRAVTLEGMIEKHGEEVGLKKWDEYRDRQKYTTTKEYFVDKYGVEIGEEKYHAFCKARGNSGNANFVAEKYNISLEEAEILISERRSAAIYKSEREIEFVNFVQEFLGELKYSCLSRQFCIWCEELNTPLFYDITDYNAKKVIEFNGDYWHCNPSRYPADYFHKQQGKTAAEIWDKDKIKCETANSRGMSVLTIWESEFLNNPDEVKEKILKWWSNDNNDAGRDS